MDFLPVHGEFLRGVWLRNTGLSLPRLLPNPLSAPTTLIPTPLAETSHRNMEGTVAHGLGNVLTELSHVKVRKLI